MHLEWLTNIGLLEERKDTGVLLRYPLPAQRAIVEQVVHFFDKDYGAACETVKDIWHLKWTLESTGTAFTLPLPACEDVVSKAADLYWIWLKEPARRPAVMQKHINFVVSELVRHLSLLFKRRVQPATQTNQEVHLRLCRKVLGVFAALGKASAAPTTPAASLPVGSRVRAVGLVKSAELNERTGHVMGYAEGRVLVDFGPPLGQRGLRTENVLREDHTLSAENWHTVVTVLLGIADYTIVTPHGLPELRSLLASVLFEALLRGSAAGSISEDLWCTVSRHFPTWPSHCHPGIRQWVACLKGLTLAIHPILQPTPCPPVIREEEGPVVMQEGVEIVVSVLWEAMPKGFRKGTDVTMEVGQAFSTWQRMLLLVRNPNCITDSKVLADTFNGVRTVCLLLAHSGWWKPSSPAAVLIPRPSPSAESILSVVGDWLLEAVFRPDGDAFLEGRAAALRCLCEVVFRPHPQPPDQPPAFLRQVYAALKTCATEAAQPVETEAAVAFRSAVVSACVHIFSHRLPDVDCLLPSFLALLSRVLKQGGIPSMSATPAHPIPLEVEDYDTDDELETMTAPAPSGRAGVPAPASSPTTPSFPDDEGGIQSLNTSTSQFEDPARNSPTAGGILFPPKAREGSLLDGSNDAMRGAGLQILAGLLPRVARLRHKHPALTAETRRLLLHALSAEREPKNLSTTVQIAAQWIHIELGTCDQPDSKEEAVNTASHLLHEVCKVLEGLIVAPLGKLVSPGIFYSAIQFLQGAALPYTAPTQDRPNPPLLLADPELPNKTAGLLARLVLDLSTDNGRRLTKPNAAKLCDCAFLALVEWLSACPSIVGDKATLKQIVDVIELGLTTATSKEALAVPSHALAAAWAALCTPFFPGPGDQGTTLTSSSVSEANYESKGSARYFALDGTKILTVLSHDTVSKRKEADMHDGGVTLITRDAFGRHVWDARLRLGTGEVRTRSNVMLQRRHGISVEPERGAGNGGQAGQVLQALLSALLPVSAEHPDEEPAQPEAMPMTQSCQATPPPPPRPPAELGRLLLAHLQLLCSSAHRVVELKHSEDLQAALAAIDSTPPRQLHRIAVVYLHSDEGTELMQDMGMEWYVQHPTSYGEDKREKVAQRLPSLWEFVSFCAGLGWVMDPAQHPEAYSGGAAGEQWRRQQVHYYAGPLDEAVWAVAARTPADLERNDGEQTTAAVGNEAEKWEDKTPVRIVWNDTPREFNPSALGGHEIRELARHFPSWSPRRSKTLDLVIHPLGGGLYSVRVVLPLGNERWLGLLPPSSFHPATWHFPMTDGMVVPAPVLPVMIRQAALTASKAFRMQWQSTFEELLQQKKQVGGDLAIKHPFTYVPPILTRGIVIHRCCTTLETVGAGIAENSLKAGPKYGEGCRVCCVRNIEMKSGRKLYVGDKGVVRRAASDNREEDPIGDMPHNPRVEVHFDCGVLCDVMPDRDVAPVPAAPFSWSWWREAFQSPSRDLASLLCPPGIDLE